MKTIDLRIERIEPELGEEVIVETNEKTYVCIAEETKNITCEGCLLDCLQECGRIVCCDADRKDKKNIILKRISGKKKEINNE